VRTQLHHLLTDTARRLGHRNALTVANSTLTYAQLSRQVGEVAAGLRRLAEERDINRLLLRDLATFPDLLELVRVQELSRVHEALTEWLRRQTDDPRYGDPARLQPPLGAGHVATPALRELEDAGDRDLAVRRAVLDGVGDQVRHHLLQPHVVGVRHQRLGFDGEIRARRGSMQAVIRRESRSELHVREHGRVEVLSE
jgi:hypothetical protein